jgi:hypothetical protein
VHEADDHRSFTDSGRAALDRARPDVARRVDAGHARLEQAVRAGVGAGQDETLVVVVCDHVVQPFGARRCSEDKDKNENGTRSPLAGRQNDRSRSNLAVLFEVHGVELVSDL